MCETQQAEQGAEAAAMLAAEAARGAGMPERKQVALAPKAAPEAGPMLDLLRNNKGTSGRGCGIGDSQGKLGRSSITGS